MKVKQRDITDCGAASLASIAAHYKLKIPVARIRQFAGTDKKGTNVTGMVEAAQKLGFDAKGLKGPFESLSKIPLPAIAHVNVKNQTLQHYVVISKVDERFIHIMDPGDGKMHKKPHDEFKKEWTNILILILPADKFEAGDQNTSIRRRFWNLIKPHKVVLIQSLVGAMVYTILGLSISVFVQKLVDFVWVDGNRNLLNTMSIAMVVLLIIQLSIGVVKSIFTLKTGQLIDAQLILGYYKHLLKLPQQFFDTMRVGEIVSRINDAVKIRTFINDVSINFLVNIFIVVFSFAMMFTYYWKLAFVLLAVIPLYGGIFWLANKLNKKVQRKLMENAADLEAQLVEGLNSVGTIKRFGLEDYTNEKTEKSFIKLLEVVYKSGKNSILSGISSDFTSKMLVIVLLWGGSSYVLDKQITPGELLSFYTLIGYFTDPISSIITMNKSMQDAIIAADRLFEIMDLEHEQEGNQIDLTPEKIGDICFRDVSFRYGTRKSVFKSLNLNISHGQFTAIVGESGSGKSTLMSLLQNIYPINSGSIFIGDYNLKYIKNSSLRNLIAVVPQQIDLFAGTLIENIAVGDYQPDIEKIINLSTQLGIMDFIESLPKGFGTYIGENGTTLSGGQRQRIAIARALYRDPEILIMDEATSSLDTKSEQYVQNAISILKKQHKTIIVIAHRLSTVIHADKIIVLDTGMVVEEGNHTSLLASKGSYANLYQ
jgi:ATP-binding cassette subfamily B protein